MSAKAVKWAASLKGLKHSESKIMSILASMCGGTLTCFPSQRTLSGKTGYSERTVRECLANLEAIGLIERRRRNRPNGSQTSNEIAVMMPKPTGKICRQPTGKICRQPTGNSPGLGLPEVFAPPEYNISTREADDGFEVAKKRASRKEKPSAGSILLPQWGTVQ